MQKIKKIIKSFIKKDNIIYKVLSKIYRFLSSTKYKILNRKEIIENHREFDKKSMSSLEVIKNYKDKKYIVFYNPTWLGVAASTKGLFENIVPLEHVYSKKCITKIADCVVENNIETIVFSQICDGWTKIIEEIKRQKSDIKIKVIWHGNCYEYFSDFTWNLNKEVMNLYKQEKIDAFGFVRTTMYEFYKKCGFKSYYLQNNVYKEKGKSISKLDSSKIRMGIYNADTRELKNIYTTLSAMKLIPNAVADIVPINVGAKKFTEILGLESDSLDCYISNEELMERIKKNDINIYPTFTENAPMFPLESFEMGVPCLLGNNNDYFVGTKLGEYVILEKEDDAVYIKNKIEEALKNKEKIMQLYVEWKKEFNIKCNRLVNEFIEG